MQNPTPKYRNTVVSLAICALGIAIVVFGTACPAPTPCTTDADCDDGLHCNGTETCVNGTCQPGTDPCDGGECDEAADACVVEGCVSDDDCEADEFCDEAGECVANVSVYDTIAFDTDKEAVHQAPSGHMNCTVCHHPADAEAGQPDATGQACVPCHSDDPNEVNSFKSVAHDLNESGDGCRTCHAAQWSDNCAFCHTALDDL